MIGRGANSVSETAEFIVAISLFAVAIASEIWEWIAWLRLRRERPASRIGLGVGLISLVAGTASIVFYVLLLSSKGWAGSIWMFSGMGLCCLALVFSLFCRGKVRLAGIVVGVLMAAYWWGLWALVDSLRGLSFGW